MYYILFIVIALFIIMYSITNCKQNNERFINTTEQITSDNIADYIYKIYRADIKAINNLADISQKIQLDGCEINNNLIIINSLSNIDAININLKNKNNILTITNDVELDGTLTCTQQNNNNFTVNGSYIYNNYLQIDNGISIYGKYDNIININNTDGFININGTLILDHVDNKTYSYFNKLDNTNLINYITNFKGKIINCKTINDINEDINKIYKKQLDVFDLYIKRLNSKFKYSTNNVGDEAPYDKTQLPITQTKEPLTIPSTIPCDKRIKENIKLANSSEILDKINQLPLLNYNYIDKRFYQGSTVYGLIAQDVIKVFPEAVNLSQEYIPNIYKIVKIKLLNNNVKLLINCNKIIKKNDTIKLIINDYEKIVHVIDYYEDYIVVNKWNNYSDHDKVLLYGTKIDNFHSLDQAYLNILSLGAIQELFKKLKQLKKYNDQLFKINNELNEKNNKIYKKLSNLQNNNV